MIPTALAVFPALVCATSWYGAGRLLPERWLPATEPLLAALSRLALGAAVLALVFYFTGRVGLYERWFQIPVTLALAAYALWAERGLWGRRPALPALGRASALLLSGAGVIAALTLLASSTPPVAVDTVRYHLALPELWFEDGEISDAFWRWESFNPFTTEILAGQGLALAGLSTAGAVAGLLGVVAILVVFGFARELAGGRVLVGAAAAFLFAFQGIVTTNVLGAYVEVPLGLYSGLAAWHTLRFIRTGATSAAVWAGLFAGGVAAVKYPGLLAGGLTVAALLIVAFARRLPRAALFACAAAVALPLPWYLKNLIVSGNPVYPLIFGGTYLDGAGTPTDAEIGVVEREVGAELPLRLLYLPLDLVWHSGHYGSGRYVGPIAFLLAVAAVLLVRTRVVLGAALLVVTYVFLWYGLIHQARFLLPALVVICGLGGLAVARLLDRGRIAAGIAVAALAASAVLWLPVGLQPLAYRMPVATGYENVDNYIERRTGTYRAFAQLARSAEGTVITVGHPMILWYPGRAIAFGSTQYEIGLPGDELWRRLETNGVTDVIVEQGTGHLGWIEALRGCLREVDSVEAENEYRESIEGVPIVLTLYSLDLCRERFATP